jgi:hypothetical protein
MNRIAHLALLSCLFVVPAASPLAAQTNTPPADPTAPSPSSLGDTARKFHKDPAKSKPKVFDNDNLPKDDKLSIVGQAAAETSPDASPNPSSPANAQDEDKEKDKHGDDKDKAKDGDPAKPHDDDQARKQTEWKQWQEKLVAQKDAIDLASRELDVLQREYQLRAAEMYADAGNRLRNQAQWDKQDADYKQQVADKEKSLADARQKLDDLQEEARKDGVPAAMR